MSGSSSSATATGSSMMLRQISPTPPSPSAPAGGLPFDFDEEGDSELTVESDRSRKRPRRAAGEDATPNTAAVQDAEQTLLPSSVPPISPEVVVEPAPDYDDAALLFGALDVVIWSGYLRWYQLRGLTATSKELMRSVALVDKEALPDWPLIVSYLNTVNAFNLCSECKRENAGGQCNCWEGFNFESGEYEGDDPDFSEPLDINADDPRNAATFKTLSARVQALRLVDFHQRCIVNYFERSPNILQTYERELGCRGHCSQGHQALKSEHTRAAYNLLLRVADVVRAQNDLSCAMILASCYRNFFVTDTLGFPDYEDHPWIQDDHVCRGLYLYTIANIIHEAAAKDEYPIAIFHPIFEPVTISQVQHLGDSLRQILLERCPRAETLLGPDLADSIDIMSLARVEVLPKMDGIFPPAGGVVFPALDAVFASGYLRWYQLRDLSLTSKVLAQSVALVDKDALPDWGLIVSYLDEANSFNRCGECGEENTSKECVCWAGFNFRSGQYEGPNSSWSLPPSINRDDPRNTTAFKSLSPRVKALKLLDFHRRCIANFWARLPNDLTKEEHFMERNGSLQGHRAFEVLKSVHSRAGYNLLLNVADIVQAQKELSSVIPWSRYRKYFETTTELSDHYEDHCSWAGDAWSFYWTVSKIIRMHKAAKHEHPIPICGDVDPVTYYQMKNLGNSLRQVLLEPCREAEDLLGSDLADSIDIMHKTRIGLRPSMATIFQ